MLASAIPRTFATFEYRLLISTPPIDVFVEELKFADGPMVPYDNLLCYVTEESFELIGWHTQLSNMAISDAPGQRFHFLEVSNRHKRPGTHIGNGYYASY